MRNLTIAVVALLFLSSSPGQGQEFASLLSLQPTKRLGTMGDSTTNPLFPPPFVKWPARVDSQIGDSWYVDQFGIAGDSVANMVNRINTDVCHQFHHYDYVTVLGGVNDININGSSAASVWSYLSNIYGQLVNVGTVPVLITILPAGSSGAWNSTKQTALESVNTSIRGYASSNNVPLVDGYALLGDPSSTTHLLPAYDSGDGIHPSQAGADALATGVLAAIPH